MAVRLSKSVLAMSGLSGAVELDVKQGQIIMRTVRRTRHNPRAGWREQIEREIKLHGPPTYVDEYGDMLKELDATIGDGLEDL
jgi:hypothetical protein